MGGGGCRRGGDVVLPGDDEEQDEGEDDGAHQGVWQSAPVAEDLTQEQQRLQQRPAAEHSHAVLDLDPDPDHTHSHTYRQGCVVLCCVAVCSVV